MWDSKMRQFPRILVPFDEYLTCHHHLKYVKTQGRNLKFCNYSTIGLVIMYKAIKTQVILYKALLIR
jgi:hypothetical protein